MSSIPENYFILEGFASKSVTVFNELHSLIGFCLLPLFLYIFDLNLRLLFVIVAATAAAILHYNITKVGLIYLIPLGFQIFTNLHCRR